MEIFDKLKNARVSLTELARLLNVSRPSLYKWIEDFEINETKKIRKDIFEMLNYIKNKSFFSKEDLFCYLINENQTEKEESLLWNFVLFLKKNKRTKNERIKEWLNNLKELEKNMKEWKNGNKDRN